MTTRNLPKYVRVQVPPRSHAKATTITDQDGVDLSAACRAVHVSSDVRDGLPVAQVEMILPEVDASAHVDRLAVLCRACGHETSFARDVPDGMFVETTAEVEPLLRELWHQRDEQLRAFRSIRAWLDNPLFPPDVRMFDALMSRIGIMEQVRGPAAEEFEL